MIKMIRNITIVIKLGATHIGKSVTNQFQYLGSWYDYSRYDSLYLFVSVF